MDSISEASSKNSLAQALEATQPEEHRKQPWKDAMVPEANANTAGEGTNTKSPDVVDEGSWEMNMTA
jgi:hypothetical protein